MNLPVHSSGTGSGGFSLSLSPQWRLVFFLAACYELGEWAVKH